MFLKTIYNISVITGSGISGGVIFLILNHLYRIHIMKKHNLITLDNIAQVFNSGFYLGSGFGLLYLFNNSKPFLCN